MPLHRYSFVGILLFVYLCQWLSKRFLGSNLKLDSSWTYSICSVPIYIWLSNFHTHHTYLLNVKYVMKVCWHDPYFPLLQTIKYEIKDKEKKIFLGYECFFFEPTHIFSFWTKSKTFVSNILKHSRNLLYLEGPYFLWISWLF